MLTHKVLCLGSLIGIMPWLCQSNVAAALEIYKAANPLAPSPQVAQTQNNNTYTPSDDILPISDEDHPGGGLRAYNPPVDSRIPEEDHSGGGVRGCGDEIVATAPRFSHTGHTQETHPTLVWYSQNDSDEFLELQLYRFDENNALEEVFIRPIQPLEANRSGYKAYTLPQDEPGLRVGDVYLWQVIQYCDSNFEEVGAATSAEIEVVPSPEAIAPELSDDTLNNAKVFSEFGLWYEAIAEVYDASTPEVESFRERLLLELAELEDQTEKESTTNIVN